MLWEIVNPSDHYTMESDSHEAASVACCLLGEGRYGLRGIDTELACPLFLFSGTDEWFQEKFGADFRQCFERSLPAIATALESVVIGDRADYNAALALTKDKKKRAAFIASWNDRHRSSMNNIGKRAASWAKQIREREKTEGCTA